PPERAASLALPAIATATRWPATAAKRTCSPTSPTAALAALAARRPPTRWPLASPECVASAPATRDGAIATALPGMAVKSSHEQRRQLRCLRQGVQLREWHRRLQCGRVRPGRLQRQLCRLRRELRERLRGQPAHRREELRRLREGVRRGPGLRARRLRRQ